MLRLKLALLYGGDILGPGDGGEASRVCTGSGALACETGRAGIEGGGPSSSSEASGVYCAGGARVAGAEAFRWLMMPAKAAAGLCTGLWGDPGDPSESSSSTAAGGLLGRLGGGACAVLDNAFPS